MPFIIKKDHAQILWKYSQEAVPAKPSGKLVGGTGNPVPLKLGKGFIVKKKSKAFFIVMLD